MTDDQHPWPEELREIVAKEIWTAYRRLGVVDWADGPVAFGAQSPVTRNHFAALGEAILDAIAASPYAVVDTRMDHGYCAGCGNWVDRRPVTSSPERGAASYRETGGSEIMDEEFVRISRERWERVRGEAALLVDMQQAGQILGVDALLPGDLDDIPADTEQPRVEAMIDELMKGGYEIRFREYRLPERSIEVMVSRGMFEEYGAEPDWRDAVRAAWRCVREGEGT